MRLIYINPNATETMTQSIVDAARKALPDAHIIGLTNHDGPRAIEGPEDGEHAVTGLLKLIPKAKALGADAIIIACFDDTGLAEMRKAADCPVLGIGQSAYTMAQIIGAEFSVVTSLAVSIPVIDGNIQTTGFGSICRSVRASGLGVLDIDAGAPEAITRLSEEINLAQTQDGATAVVLGCAGMAHLRELLAAKTNVQLIDGVAASAYLAQSAVRFLNT
ncbi:aspartate/glutamate racemase family protein [Pacificibacter sp. AS14]|uniref:aspartate/glutamate racemase family protein n=1 Tax=Pacificibacter sp. AS14 TaxID=3135785 RepID=UPI00317E7285